MMISHAAEAILFCGLHVYDGYFDVDLLLPPLPPTSLPLTNVGLYELWTSILCEFSDTF